MANIKVYLLNFHRICSHIEIVLEDTTSKPHTFYRINRWSEPLKRWATDGHQSLFEQASSVFSFDIKANPDEIVKQWEIYFWSTADNADICAKNCADAAQWFLTEFASIPKPSLENVSWNHLALGLVWPSFIPCPITLPGRIFSNAKFYIEIRDNPELLKHYIRYFLYTALAFSALIFAASFSAIAILASDLTDKKEALAIVACATSFVGSTYSFFKARNKLSAHNIASALTSKTETMPLLQVDSFLTKEELKITLGVV